MIRVYKCDVWVVVFIWFSPNGCFLLHMCARTDAIEITLYTYSTLVVFHMSKTTFKKRSIIKKIGHIRS